MNPVEPRPDANRCFVCGPANAVGLRIRFRLDDDRVCRASFVPGDQHCGYDQLTHGGIIYSVLDDVMANWLFLQGVRGHTARCAIRYRKPHPAGAPIHLEGRLLRRRGNVAFMEGRAAGDDGQLIAEAEGSFMIVGPAPTLSVPE